jgi:hypothetical protein
MLPLKTNLANIPPWTDQLLAILASFHLVRKTARIPRAYERAAQLQLTRNPREKSLLPPPPCGQWEQGRQDCVRVGGWRGVFTAWCMYSILKTKADHGGVGEGGRGPISCYLSPPALKLKVITNNIQSPNFQTFKEPRNHFRGVDSSSLCSQAGRYDNPAPIRFLVPIDCSKIPAQDVQYTRT